MGKGDGGWVDFNGTCLVHTKETVVGPPRVKHHRSKEFYKRRDMRKGEVVAFKCKMLDE